MSSVPLQMEYLVHIFIAVTGRANVIPLKTTVMPVCILLTINLQLAAWMDRVTSRSAHACVYHGSSVSMITWDEAVCCEVKPPGCLTDTRSDR